MKYILLQRHRRNIALFLIIMLSLAPLAFAEKKTSSDKPVTFEQVLADPENVDLNLRFAKGQIKEGDLVGASSSLERVLLVKPADFQVKLLHAVVLFRLDNLHESEVELKSLTELKLPAAIHSEVNAYLGEIKKRKKSTHLGFRESIGFQFDSNRNVAPESKERLFADIRIPVTPQNGRKGDTSFLNITTVDLAQDLGFQAGHQLIGSFTYFLAEQNHLDSLDLSSYEQEYGIALKNRYLNITPTVFIENVLLSRETFLRSQGGRLYIDHNFFNKLNLYGLGSIATQDYVDITENLAAHERRGNRIDGGVGARYALHDKLRFGMQYSYVDKDAKEEYNAYTSNVFGFNIIGLPGKGQFLILMLELARDRYEAPDLALYSRHRRDNAFTMRITYGAPLTFFLIGKILPKVLGSMIASVTYEYGHVYSNVPNYAYANHKIQTMLSQKWDF